MKKRIILVLNTCLFGWIWVGFASFNVSAASYRLELKVQDLPESKIVLAEIYGDKTQPIDTALTDKKGVVRFILTDKSSRGLYRVFFDRDRFADLVFNYEDIEVETLSLSPMDSLTVIRSVENRIYYEFLRMDADFQLKIELLIPITSWFPREDDFYDLAAAKFMKLQNERDDWILKMAAEHPDAFVTKMLLFQRNPSIPFGLTEESKTRFMQQHYFDRIDWKDPELLRTDLIPLKIINYLTVYSNRNYTQRQLEAAFKEAVDNLLSRPFNDALLKEFVIGYLVKGFEKYGFEEVIVHIAENYQDDAACEHTERKGDLASRLENFKKLAVGKTAPDFVIPGENGHPIHFSDFRSEYLLVIFWATWCPHCTEWLPQIDQLYRTKKNSVEVLTISLDQDEKQWKEYLTEKKFTWYNGCDFKGWNGEMTLDFNIYATPTLIVLDRKRKIISKPMTMDELSILFSGE